MAYVHTSDLEAKAKRPGIVAAAAAVLGVEGAFVFLVGLQNVLIVRWAPPYCYAVYALMLVGAACALLALKVARARMKPFVVGIVAAAALMAGTSTWLWICVRETVYSLLSIVSVVGAVATLALLGAALPYCRETERARAAMRAQGIEYDL